jgi:DHA1 family multidrug resistance protein-like MFS transporter
MSLWENPRTGTISWQKNLAVLWIGVFLACASYTSCIPFLPVYLLKELSVDEGSVNYWTSLVYSVTFLGSSLMAPYWGAWADKVGQRKMAIRAGFGLVVTYWMAAIVQSAWQLFLVRGLAGVISGYVPASMSLISSTLPEERMGWGMGMMQTAVASGSILGPLMGGYLSAWFGMRMSFTVGAASLLVATIMTILMVRDQAISKERQRAKINLMQDLKVALHNRDLVYIMFMFFLIQVCTMTIQPLITLYVSSLMGGTSDESIKMSGWVFSLAGIAGIFAAPFWGNKGQRFGYTKILCLVLLCAGVVNLCQIFIGNVWQFAVIQFVYGLFLSGAVPNINSNLVEVTESSMRGKAFGLVTSAQQFGGVVGPLLGAFLGGFMSTRLVLCSMGGVLLLTALYTYKFRLHRNITEEKVF